MAGRLMSTAELAEYLGLKVNTIEVWRTNGLGPPYLRFGGRTIRYDLDEVMKWAERVDPSEPEQDVTKVAKKDGDYEEYSMPKINFRKKTR